MADEQPKTTEVASTAGATAGSFLAGFTFGGLLEVLVAFFRFPDAITKLIRLFQRTPTQQHEDLLKTMQAEQDRLTTGDGRPS